MTDNASKPRRLNDLDALRGFAMLLGIALHAALSFLPGFWAVQDSRASFDGLYDELLHAIHGFRMPLFFLLSGFFTTMLWKRRGLGALVSHRARRIAVPLAIGVITIIPLMNVVIDRAVDDAVTDSGDIWTAVFVGNEATVERLLDSGFDVNARQSGDRTTALHLTVLTNDFDMAELLIGRGAEIDARSGDGSTPLSWAIYFGRSDMADLLVAEGAEDMFRPAGGEWADVEFFGEGAEFVEDIDTVGIESWVASFHHLWFLWFLLWLVAGFALVAFAVERIGGAGDGRWSSRLMWALIPLALVPQLMMGNGGEYPAFGPDTSTGLVPLWHVLGYYAVFFAFGALLWDRTAADGTPMVERMSRRWGVILPLTVVVVLPLALGATFADDRDWGFASILQVTYTWGMIVGLMGLFRVLLSKERRGVRYLSDSSYWLYVAHLPLVISLQSLIRTWDLPAAVKFWGMVVVASAILLGTYQLFVRYTPIGTMLNGARTRPPKVVATSPTTLP